MRSRRAASWLRSERGVQVLLAWAVVTTFFVVLWLFARHGGPPYASVGT